MIYCVLEGLVYFVKVYYGDFEVENVELIIKEVKVKYFFKFKNIKE